MLNLFDVVAYVLQRTGPVTAMKLQKLVYYCQAWSLVWDERPLFTGRIEAWANGPVSPDLYAWHKGLFTVSECPKGDAASVEADALGSETIEAVLGHYAKYDGQQLSDLTHNESPWKDARVGLADGERGCAEITHAAMAEFYEGLLA